MKIISIAIVVLSVLDVILTTIWLEFGIALEANPLMDTIVYNTPLFAFIKMFLTIGGVHLLYKATKLKKKRQKIIGQASLIFCFLTYIYVFVQHAIGIKYFINL